MRSESFLGQRIQGFTTVQLSQETGSGRSLVDGLDEISVRVDHKGGVVVFAVVRSPAGRAVVLPAVPQRFRMKAIDGFMRGRGKGDVKPGTGRRHPSWPELEGELVTAAGHSLPDGLGIFPHANTAERGERGVVKVTRSLQIGDAEGEVVQYRCCSLRG